MPMKVIDFPNWPEVLAQSELPPRVKHAFEITLRWYLSFCRRGRAEVTVESARDFIAWATEQKQPQPWQVEQWKEGIRWFFRTAKDQQQTTAQPGEQAWLPESRTGWPESGKWHS
jgi:hypothetical protein